MRRSGFLRRGAAIALLAFGAAGADAQVRPAEPTPAAQPATPAAGGTPAGGTPAGAGPGGRRMRAEDREPVTFTAGEVNYDRERNVVTATGGVEAWQNDRVLRAREVTFDRNTNRATARGDVVLIEADGRVLFAEEADLTDDLREGVITGIRGLLAAGGRFAANGAVRTEGRITDMRRGVYSTCNDCPTDPTRAPLWQLRANRMIHDDQEKLVEYFGATMEFAGVPVAYTPYLSHADPSVKRKSGLLFPDFGSSSYLGQFYRQPYYWVISPNADATIAPMITSKQGAVLYGEYRQRFNAGFITGSGSYTRDTDGDYRGHIFSNGRFSLDQNWRAGFDAQRSSDNTYLRRYRAGTTGNIDNSAALITTPFAEGFWRSSYARVDSFFYQGLGSEDDDRRTPLVLPRAFYAYDGPLDRVGGRLSADLGAFATTRRSGTDTRRLASRVGYAMPFAGSTGERYLLESQVDFTGYQVGGDPELTSVVGGETGTQGRVHPQIAATVSYPMVRPGGSWGSQVIEPLAQLVAGPNTGKNPAIPNEDSIDLEFTDATLFGFNRFPGRDRMDGGVRTNLGVKGGWYAPNGVVVDGLFGQAFRTNDDDLYPKDSGLEGRRSDYVGRLTLSPNDYLSFSYRTRLDKQNLNTSLADIATTVRAGPTTFIVSYLTGPPQPEALQPFARREISGYANARIGSYWNVFAGARRNLATEKMVSSYGGISYDDECFSFYGIFIRRFTTGTDEEDQGKTDLVLRLVFKTVGQFGFSAF